MSDGAYTDGASGHFPSKGARIELLTTHLEVSYRINGPPPSQREDVDVGTSSG